MKEDLLKGRAWIEINLNNLEHNILEIQKIISNKTKIMAVVKANAYGHGMVLISKKLNQMGIFDFAVATLQEGITLRENGIVGNILILGYTSPQHIKYVLEYDLIQTVVDLDYAKELEHLFVNQKIKVHLKINTGMNRLGINYQDVDSIKKLYSYNNLNILGIFSHLCVADSKKMSDIEFTKGQITSFNNLIQKLKSFHLELGKIHLQSSYGVLNYPFLEYDYVRIGIIMYGVHSEKNSFSKVKIDLKPVLSLKARVVSVKEVDKGNTVGYGRTYKIKKKEKIATVSIGYADGIPWNVSGKNVKVLINNSYAPVVGRICMDQLMINVSEVLNVKPGDIVTLIGDDKQISATELSFKSKTITNELLSRLKERLNYIVVDEKNNQ